MSDEQFWEHWIADTPEEDQHYSGCGWVAVLIVGLLLSAAVILGALL